MKFATALVGGEQKLIVFLTDRRVLNLTDYAANAGGAELPAAVCADMLSMIETEGAYDQAIRAACAAPDGKFVLDVSEVKLLAPIPMPRKNLIVVGKNYRSPLTPPSAEPPFPRFSTKPWTAITGPDMPMLADFSQSDQIDYEGELAVIVGKKCKNVQPEDAMDCVFGYSIINDGSARDIQDRHAFPYKGKAMDTLNPFGPCIVTTDEIPDYRKLHIQTEVNGELRQSGSCSDMIFDIPMILYYLSYGTTLHPGDIICTGTPMGIGKHFDPPKYLRDGDVVKITIDGIGTLTNYAKDERNV